MSSPSRSTRRFGACSWPECEEKWSVLRCSRCKRAHYCCKEHQALHWKSGHRDECNASYAQDVNSASALARRCLLLPSGLQTAGSSERDIEKKKHVHVKKGLKDSLSQQRKICQDLNSRLRQIESAMAERRRRSRREEEEEGGRGRGRGGGGEIDEVLSENYRRPELKSMEESLKPLSIVELEALRRETLRLRDLSLETAGEMEKDLGSVAHWERYESGFETRDVLANGERRLHMELRYGREVTVEDVEKEMEGMSKDQRKMKLIEGIGKDGSDGRLPGPLRLDNITTLMGIEN